MKKLLVGTAVAGVLFIGLRACLRHCQTMMSEHSGASSCSDANSCSCA